MFRRFLAAFFAALARANSALRGAYGFLHDAVEEAVEPVASSLPWLRDRAADAGQASASIAAGILSLPGAVLGALMPRPALTPQAVADDAVAHDDNLGGGGVLSGDEIYAMHFQGAAEALRDRGEAGLALSLPYIPEGVAEWLRSLDRRQLEMACRLDPADLVRHATAERLSDCSRLLPPPLHLQDTQAGLTPAEVTALVRKAKTRMAGEAREVAEMMKRGPRPVAEPSWDSEPAWGAGPSLH
ncbi:hypothetical protein [Methylobacterium mesophilicum]